MATLRAYLPFALGNRKESLFRPNFEMSFPETSVENINFSKVTRSLLITEQNTEGNDTPIALAYIKPGQRVAFAYLAELAELN